MKKKTTTKKTTTTKPTDAAKRIIRNMDDIHPADYNNREALRRWLVAEKHRQCTNDRLVSERVGHQSSWSHGIVNGTSWRAASIQKMVRALGYRLTFNVDPGEGVILPDADPIWQATFNTYQNSENLDRREEADRIALSLLVGRLRAARGLTAREVGLRLNCEGKTVLAFEAGEKPGYLMVTAQRFFRALDAELKFVIVAPASGDIPETCFEVPPLDLTPGTIDVAIGNLELNPNLTDWEAAINDAATQLVAVQSLPPVSFLPADNVHVVQAGNRVLIWADSSPNSVISLPVAGWHAWLDAQAN